MFVGVFIQKLTNRKVAHPMAVAALKFKDPAQVKSVAMLEFCQFFR